MALDRAVEPHLPAGAVKRAGRTAVDYSELESRLGYIFADGKLLVRALTHVSALAIEGDRAESYQRLEFLGDRVLGLVVASTLYEAFPQADEGDLSRRLADLVRRETCAEVALEWQIDSYVRLGEGEAQSGGRRKAAILSDICESLIGAVFVDGGYEAARKVVSTAWAERMLKPKRPLQDAKTALQEWAQARGRPTPRYHEIERSGPAHAPEFVIAVAVEGFDDAQASGSSKRAAEQAAAAAFMARETSAEKTHQADKAKQGPRA